jgi:F0F1-type ATP synthase membrane subunit c/vacuolar-type H+-ATPase subunit K
MNMRTFLITSFAFALTTSASFVAAADLTASIPEINAVGAVLHGYHKQRDVAQYKNADWNNVVGIARGISVSQACEIANNNPEISFFFYTKGKQMVLETSDGDNRIFHQGDTVFFSGNPWWGSAPGLADGYVKQ